MKKFFNNHCLPKHSDEYLDRCCCILLVHLLICKSVEFVFKDGSSSNFNILNRPKRECYENLPGLLDIFSGSLVRGHNEHIIIIVVEH